MSSVRTQINLGEEQQRTSHVAAARDSDVFDLVREAVDELSVSEGVIWGMRFEAFRQRIVSAPDLGNLITISTSSAPILKPSVATCATLGLELFRRCVATALTFVFASLLLPLFASATASIVVTDAWSRPASGTAVVYATIVNAGHADRLTGGTSPAAGRVELHESTSSAMPMDAMNGMPMNGAMMSMRSLAAIPIAAHATRRLAPGGYHLMLAALRHELKAGETVPLRLHFARAGWVSVIVFVRGN